jgi:beta-phosphoglucomutase
MQTRKELLFRKIYEPDIKLLKGLKAFFDMLRRNNILMAVGTSAPPENVDFVFNHTGIKKYFDVVLDERAVTIGKPNPEIYLKAAKALNFDPADCIVIEDSLSGIEAGKRAGSKVIGITTTHSDAELSHADLTAADFLNLVDKGSYKLIYVNELWHLKIKYRHWKCMTSPLRSTASLFYGTSI